MIFVFVQVVSFLGLIYSLRVNNKDIKIIIKARYIFWKIDKIGSKCKIAFTSLNNILLEVYNIKICKIHAFL